ncbi:MAG: Stp1/IreP family PP2C-type Ser/Thr phosphatase [Solirubrobacteraceae bacterium]
MLRAADTILKTDTGRQRRDNEDSAFMRVPLFVVADGMGGAQAGEVASWLAVQEFEQHELPDDGSFQERLATLIRSANLRIYELARAEREYAGMGTTLTAVYVEDDALAVAHVGDSRAYIFRESELVRLTEDHSLVEELVRQGKLTEQQAAEHPQRSIVTRVLGIEPDVRVDTWSYPVHAGDVVLLCSDGLTSMIDEGRVSAILTDEPALERAAELLIAAANEAGGRDNITVLLFRLEEADGHYDAIDRPTEVRTPAAATATIVAPAQRVQSRAPRPQVQSGPRLAKTQGRRLQEPVRRRRSERYIKLGAALIAVVVVLFLVGGGAYLASREYFFISTNSAGIVTVYRGFPYDLPLGIHMYEQYYVSGVPIGAIPSDRRAALLNHQLRSESGAIGLVRSAELGQLSR